MNLYEKSNFEMAKSCSELKGAALAKNRKIEK